MKIYVLHYIFMLVRGAIPPKKGILLDAVGSSIMNKGKQISHAIWEDQ
jgi:hypothetical protein